MEQSSASLSEYRDPILYTENPKLAAFIEEKRELGRDHDINNSTCLYYPEDFDTTELEVMKRTAAILFTKIRQIEKAKTEAVLKETEEKVTQTA